MVATITTYTEITINEVDYYKFSFTGIAAKAAADVFTATIYGTKDSVELNNIGLDYSVKQYCMNQLAQTSDAELQTLCVDLLNYAAKAQAYFGYKTESYANIDLTETQQGYATSATPTMANSFVRNVNFETDNYTDVTLYGMTIVLKDRVKINFCYNLGTKAANISNLKLVVKDVEGNILATINGSDFVANGSYYFATFDELTAKEMRTVVYATMYEVSGETEIQVSNTMSYSIESYACNKQASTTPNLSDLVIAMMKYGDAAEAYLN